MNIRTERRGLGRGLGELFQRTEPQPIPASSTGDTHARQRPVGAGADGTGPRRLLFRRTTSGLDHSQPAAAQNCL